MPGKNQYFFVLRQNYIKDRVNALKNTLIGLEIATTRLDDRIIQPQNFIEDDEFIKSTELKSFLYKIKQSEMVLKMNSGE